MSACAPLKSRGSPICDFAHKAPLLLEDACREEIVPAEVKKTGATKLPTAGLPPKHLPTGQTALFRCAPTQSSREDPNIEAGVYSHYVAKYARGEAPAEFLPGEVYGHDAWKAYVEQQTR